MRKEELGGASRQEARPQGQSKVSHTPGPWSFEPICFDLRIPIRGGRTIFDKPFNVALINRPPTARFGEDKANAYLISAPPDLLAALHGMINAYWRGSEDGDDNHAPSMVKAALSAIAKAEGRR